MADLLEIGIRIKKQRTLLHITREELAEIVDISPRFCYDIELGNKGMSIDTLCKLSSALSVTTDYILFGDTTERKGVSEMFSLCEQCPGDKRENLANIMSEYLQAVKK